MRLAGRMRPAGRRLPRARDCSIKDMCERYKRKVRTLTGCTKDIQIDVCFHQGSALSPFLFNVILDVLTECIETGLPNAIHFADNLVIFEEIRKGRILTSLMERCHRET